MFTYRTSSVARERESEQDISSLISILNMLPDTKPSVWQPGISVVSCFTVKWLRVMELPLKPLPYKTGHLLRRQSAFFFLRLNEISWPRNYVLTGRRREPVKWAHNKSFSLKSLIVYNSRAERILQDYKKKERKGFLVEKKRIRIIRCV